ncbi:unnamed protein product [Diamesa tonsa]
MKAFLLVAMLVASVVAESVVSHFEDCEGFENSKCKINEVRIDPCPMDDKTKACVVKRGTDASMAIDFTPDFDGSDVQFLAYGIIMGETIAFKDMNPNACMYTSCPVASGTRQTYNYSLKLSRAYPKTTTTVKWVMSTGGVDKCCFMNKIKLK